MNDRLPDSTGGDKIVYFYDEVRSFLSLQPIDTCHKFHKGILIFLRGGGAYLKNKVFSKEKCNC